MASRPAYSPWLPHSVAATRGQKPVSEPEFFVEVFQHQAIAFRLVDGREGMLCQRIRQENGIISAVAFSFMVQEPSGIIERLSAMSFCSRCLK